MILVDGGEDAALTSAEGIPTSQAPSASDDDTVYDDTVCAEELGADVFPGETLAWSQTDDDEVAEPPRWRRVLVWAVLVVLVCLLSAVVGAFLMRLPHQHPTAVPPSPPVVRAPTTVMMPPPPPPPPPLSPPPVTVSVTPTPLAAPPAPPPEPAPLPAPTFGRSPATPIAPPPPASPDDAYVADLGAAGVFVTDRPTAIAGAHAICNDLGAGGSPADIVRGLRSNSTLTEANAEAIIALAVRVYCPQYIGN